MSCCSSPVRILCCIPRAILHGCRWLITKATCGFVNLLSYDPNAVITSARELEAVWSGMASADEKASAWQAFCAKFPGIEKAVERKYILQERAAQLPNSSDKKAVAAWNKDYSAGAIAEWKEYIEANDPKVADRIIGFYQKELEG